MTAEEIRIQGDAFIQGHRCAAFSSTAPRFIMPDGKEVRLGPGLTDDSLSSGPYLDRKIRCGGCGATWHGSNRKEGR